MGDFSAHIDCLDRRTDETGLQLLQIIEDKGLKIQNVATNTIGKYTYTEGKRKSCIDYVLVTPNLGQIISKMLIDEEKQWNVGSDHNLIQLEGRMARKMRNVETWWTFDKTKWSQKVKALSFVDQVAEKGLDALHKQVIESRAGCFVPHKGIRGSGERGWWDIEIEKAIQRRKSCSRHHRQLLAQSVSSTNIEVAWKQYLEAKKEAQTLEKDPQA